MNLLKELSKNTQLKIAFMPIKPPYVERILKGEKLFEFRRTMINEHLTHIIIYSSSPVKKIVGIADVKRVHSGSPSAIWENTKYGAGISRKKYREYFNGAKRACAIELGNIYQCKKEIDPIEIDNNLKIPQSYSYVSDEILIKTSKKGLITQ